MMHLPLWFKALVYSEIFLQLPFFFVATYAFIGERWHAAAALHSAQPAHSAHAGPARWAHDLPALFGGQATQPPRLLCDRGHALSFVPAGKKNWIRIPAVFYGAFVSATMLPILAELAAHTGAHHVGEAYLLVLLSWPTQHGCHLCIVMLPILAELAAHTVTHRLMVHAPRSWFASGC